MKVKEEYKGQTITINDGILGMIKIDLNTIKPMQQRRLIALGYTHLFEDEKVESHESTEEKILESVKEIAVEGFIDIYANGMKDAIESQKAPVKKTRRKKSV
jgi:hypothetical protein